MPDAPTKPTTGRGPHAFALTDPRLFAPLLFLLAARLSAWYANRGLPFQDEGSTLTAAAKILRGGVFYLDIDAYPFPGAPYLLAAFMSGFGEDLAVARALAGACYCASVLALYAASLQLLDRSRAALFGLSLLCFKFLAWPSFSVYMYSDLAFSCACIAIALLVGRTSRSPLRPLLAGLFVALSLASKQNLGIYLGGAGVALLAAPALARGASQAGGRERWLPLLAFVLGAAVPLTAMMAYFAAHGVLGAMLYSGLIRPFTGYLPTGGISFGSMLAWWELGQLRDMPASKYFILDYFQLLQQQRLPGLAFYDLYWLAGELFSRALYTSIPIGFGLAALRSFRAVRDGGLSGRKAALASFALLAGAVVLSAFPRADFFHIIAIFPVVSLLLFALFQPRDESVRSARLVTASVLLGLLICGTLAGIHRSYLNFYVELPRAHVVVDPSKGWMETLVRVISQDVAPDEPLLVYGHEAHIYFLTDRFFPWPFSQLYPGQAGGDGGEELVRRLTADPPRYIVQGILKWPGLPSLPEYAPALEGYIRENYVHDKDFFRNHPMPDGAELPLSWVVSVLRPRESQ